MLKNILPDVTGESMRVITKNRASTLQAMHTNILNSILNMAKSGKTSISMCGEKEFANIIIEDLLAREFCITILNDEADIHTVCDISW